LETARLLLGVLVATSLPASVPALRRRPALALVFSSAFAWYAILPTLDRWAAAFTWLAAVTASQLNCLLRRRLSADASVHRLSGLLRRSKDARTPVTVAAFLLVPVGTAWIALHGSRYGRALAESAGSDEFAVAVSGLLLAVFVGNDLAYLAVRPYFSKLSESGTSIVPSGIYIGWVERAVIFAFVAGGQADAAALAVAAKALIRLPQVQDEAKGSILGEYIIVGTLASVLASILAAVAVRLALGLPAL
jgi:hypothetical protein